MAALLVAAGLWAYAPSLGGAFVFDDFAAIIQNPNIRSLWPLSRAMSAPPDTTLSGRPVASLTFALNAAVTPPDARDVSAAWGYHLVNIAIHLSAALALFGVVRRTLISDRLRTRFGPASSGLSFAVALLWVVHPLNTEAVAYVVQRVESLMGLLALLTLYCAIRATGAPRARPWHVCALASHVLALGSKEVAAGMPLVVIVWDFFFHPAHQPGARRGGAWDPVFAPQPRPGREARTCPRGSWKRVPLTRQRHCTLGLTKVPCGHEDTRFRCCGRGTSYSCCRSVDSLSPPRYRWRTRAAGAPLQPSCPCWRRFVTRSQTSSRTCPTHDEIARREYRIISRATNSTVHKSAPDEDGARVEGL